MQKAKEIQCDSIESEGIKLALRRGWTIHTVIQNSGKFPIAPYWKLTVVLVKERE